MAGKPKSMVKNPSPNWGGARKSKADKEADVRVNQTVAKVIEKVSGKAGVDPKDAKVRRFVRDSIYSSDRLAADITDLEKAYQRTISEILFSFAMCGDPRFSLQAIKVINDAVITKKRETTTVNVSKPQIFLPEEKEDVALKIVKGGKS